MSIRWLHIFHRWSRWETGTGCWSSPLFKIPEQEVAIQTRECSECGKQEIRRVG